MRRYRFIEQHLDAFPIDAIAGALGVSRSGFYAWRDRPDSARRQRRNGLSERVRSVFDEHHAIYGARKVAAELVEQNIRVCRNTVAGLMREMGLRSRAQKRRRFTVTTDSDHADPIASNTLDRDFAASRPNEKWVADITYVPIDEGGGGFAYMAAVMDLYSRRIVGWSVGDSLETSLVLDALGMALESRRPEGGGGGLLHHSDRGCQYASGDYRRLLDRHGIECSMSRRGNCWDNATMERFMGSYKHEWVLHERHATVESVYKSTFRYIEMFYNRRRRHQALGYVSPVEYELIHRGTEAA